MDRITPLSPGEYASLLKRLPSRVHPGTRPHTLWGMAPVAPIHLGFDQLIVHQQWLVQAEAQHVVLLADLHAALSRGLSPAVIAPRAAYYQHYLQHVCGLSATFVRGTDIQRSPDYVDRLYTLLASARLNRLVAAAPDARTAFAVSQVAMQLVDPLVLGVDAVFADVGQAKIYDALPPDQRDRLSAGHGPNKLYPTLIYADLSCDTRGRPLRESTSQTRITIHDDHATLTRKIKKMYAPPAGQPLVPGSINALLEHFQWSVFPWTADPVPVRTRGGGGYSFFSSYEDLADAYEAGAIHPADGKNALLLMLWARLQDVQHQMPPALTSWITER
ncbi:hypothetical protein [Nonomuraea sp. NPDC046570]|uniref:hypothetical protein n=1 Tax=Nonomuraea sp. NPDC046570 TaxID=3155255 RepID=UPI0033FE48FF